VSELPPAATRSAARLSRLAFADGARAAELLSAALGWWDLDANRPTDDSAAVVIAALGRSADPDGALDALAEIVGTGDDGGLRAAITVDADLRTRLVSLLGVSVELGNHLRTHPRDWQVLVGDIDAAGVAARLAGAVGADADDPVTGTSGTRAGIRGPDAAVVLRDAYRRELIAIAGRDLSGDLDLRLVTELLADLAGHTLQAALAVAAAELPDTAVPCRLAVIAMGKTGSRELNYVSDVDVVFVAEPATGQTDEKCPDADVDGALSTATKLAGDLMRLCHSVAWEVDANLRPEGKNGVLVRTLASHEAYYARWASTWEFQALLKARPIAGDADLGRDYAQVITPLVWTAAERPGFVADVRAMRRRVVDHIPATVGERDLKLGRGGLRDVEFAVQLLQLVHGRADETLRTPETLPALDALRNGGYVGRDDAVSLIDAYRFLRATEHRLQLRRLRRTHVLPESAQQQRWLAKAMGYRPDHRGDALAVFRAEWDLHAREVRRLHEKLFYRPLLEAVARVPSANLRLTTAEAGRRLAALGFADPAAALRHIESLTAGLSRRAALQRTLLPVLLDDFADAPDPDAGLLAYRRISEALGATPWYLRLLRDGDTVVSRLAYVLGVSRYVPRMLTRAPEALRMLGADENLRPRKRSELVAAMQESAARHEIAAVAVTALRGVRRQELLRTAFGDLLGELDAEAVCSALSATLDATLEATLDVAVRAIAAERGLDVLPIRFAIIAMGRLGGAETGYGSDADVLFVHENVGAEEEVASRLAHDVAGRLRALLGSASASDPPLSIDANLRPEGSNGALVRSLASYERYYARWSSAWEAQALLRARPVAGDVDLGRRFVEMIDPVRYPDGGVAPDDLIEIRRIKGRMDSERLPRGADPTTHTKLGRGGLADIEWTIQLLQLEHGHHLPDLRTTRTLEALAAARDVDLLTAEQADTLATAWRFATRARNAIMLVRDKPGDQLPAMGAELAAVARVMGYPPHSDPGQLVDDYRRAGRRARKVVELVFYGP
jgi:[glutamine synthetase] adenylyltransferase / [glutamine synthetase]-adenylyl-L-tyrosine phosphorylase